MHRCIYVQYVSVILGFFRDLIAIAARSKWGTATGIHDFICAAYGARRALSRLWKHMVQEREHMKWKAREVNVTHRRLSQI